MAGKIRLKRSDTTGNVPDAGNLSLGELAVNTYDGKLFFTNNDGSVSLETIVTTNAQISGFLEMTGAVKSSFALIKTQSTSGDVLTVNVGGQDKVTINNDGTLVVKEVATLPTGEKGARSVSGSNFFVYL